MKKRTILYAISSLIATFIFAHTGHAKIGSQPPSGTFSPSMSRASNAMQELLNAEKLREDAMARGDAEQLKRLFSDYYYHVESNGRVRSKTQLLTAVQRRELRFLSYKVDDVEIRLSGLVAIAIGRFTIVRVDGRHKRHYSGRFMRVWEHDGSRWRNTMHQSTEVKPLAVNAPTALPIQ